MFEANDQRQGKRQSPGKGLLVVSDDRCVGGRPGDPKVENELGVRISRRQQSLTFIAQKCASARLAEPSP